MTNPLISMQSITSSISAFSLTRQLSSAGNKIKEILTDSQTALQTKFKLEKRNAVRYIIQAGHRFRPALIIEPTCCSNCDELIYVWGFECTSCKLSCHKRCLQATVGKCVRDQQSGGSEMVAAPGLLEIAEWSQARQSTNEQLGHNFEPKTFGKFTYCKHCGTLIKGLVYQGLECRKCNMTVHFGCKQNVCLDCQSSASSISNTATLIQLEDDNDRQYEQLEISKIRIEDFQIVKLIGTGSFSKVYLARLRRSHNGSSLGNRVGELEFAIKVIKKTDPVIGSDPQSVFSELRTLRLGKKYPFLAVAHCCFQSRDRLYLVMEHVAGIDFVHLLSRHRKFTEDQARFYAAEIALALMSLHEEQIVYRDMKLDNVILDRDGHCKLIDFGMSKELSKSGTKKTRTFCGTPNYISPEIILEQDYDYSVDWWSFGVLLYEMLVGHSPFDAYCEDDIYKLILREPVRIPEYLSLQAKSIISGLLTKEPQCRLGCQAMKDAAIREHPFFIFSSPAPREYKWGAIEAKKICPPLRPAMDDFNTSHDREGSPQMDLNLSPVSSCQLKGISQEDFQGFSYYSESFQSLSNLDLN